MGQAGGGLFLRALNCKPGALFSNLAIGMTYKEVTYLLGSFLPYHIGGEGACIVFKCPSQSKMLRS